MLAEVVAQAGADAGAPALLERFAAWRAADRSGVVRFTDGLVKLFGDTRPGVGVLRNLGLLLFDLTPPAKSALARVSAGFGGPAPRLARGLPVVATDVGGVAEAVEDGKTGLLVPAADPEALYEYFLDNFWFATADLEHQTINAPLGRSNTADSASPST